MMDEDRIRQLPCWNGSIDVSPLHGGLSNANYLVTDNTGKHVVRFGKDYPFHHVSREREVMVARAAHAAGLAPAVHYASSGVMVSQYLGASTYGADDVKAKASRVGKMLRRFHDSMPALVTGPGFMFWVFHVIRDYANTLRSAQSLHAPMLPEFLKEAAAFEAAQLPMPIIFGHHDLLPANFLDDGERLWLIDFEYAGFGTAMFDLAGASSNALMNADERDQLLYAYFAAKPDPQFLRAFAAMECASLLRETLWAMVSGLYLAAPGVDYDVYASDNFAKYRAALLTWQNQYGKIKA